MSSKGQMQRFCVRTMFFTVVALLLAAPGAFAQKVAYQDFDGKWHVMDHAEKPRFTEAQLKTEGAVIRPATTDITFTVVFNDVVNNTDIGFDDPTLGATRQDTVLAVLEYIDDVLIETGGCQIEFDNSMNSPGSSQLAHAGPYVWVIDGFQPAFALTHITTGTDPDGNPNFPDITGAVNFGKNWNSDLDDPTGSEYDLFSVLLHEITHGLGFLSMSASDGSSAVGGKTFLLYDDHLYTGNANKMWDSGGNFLGASSWMIGGDGGVLFHGTNVEASYGSFVPIFAPDPWMTGSSIGHWGQGLSPSPVMQYSLGTGIKRRGYVPFEIEALKDIGYDTESLPDIAVSPSSLDFGDQDVNAGPTSPLESLIENLGTGALNFNLVEISGDPQESFVVNPSSAFSLDPLPGGESRPISIVFDPSTPGAKTATLTITTNDPDEPETQISLTGTGTGTPETAARPEWELLE